MDLLIELALTGRIGPVRAGMPLSEAEALLGPGRPHPMLRMRPDADGYPYFWGSLSLEVSGGEVTRVELRLRPGTRLELPAALGSRHDGASAEVAREEFLGALKEAGCSFEADDQSAVSGQSSVTTQAGTTAFFVEFSASESVQVAGYYLVSLHNRG
ncbi:hypothetical protein [Lentzea sp. NPDC051838]|uniref:hypothetical protein n=1 Tax=Lentzea sp. NPDC051838 TaxID=3154849 RepID=UPI0034193968